MMSSEQRTSFPLLIAACAATFLVAIPYALGEKFKILGLGALGEVALAVVLFWMFPERGGIKWSLMTATLLLGCAVALGFAWIAGVGLWQVTAAHEEIWRAGLPYLLVGFASKVLIAPLFEEKVVRNLLLCGAIPWLGSLWASLIVSVLFGIVHPHTPVFAFFFSLVLCWLAVRWHVNSYQRAAIHGALNLIIELYVISGGLSCVIGH